MLYVLFFCILVFTENFYFRLADRLNIIDKPNERSSHTQITLRGGGIIFYGGMLLYSFMSGFSYPWFFGGLTLIAGVSMADDIRDVPGRVRIIIHFAAMLLMFYQWDLFTSYPGWYILIALILFTGIINAYNFMDGINGITGGYSLVVLGALIYINTVNVQYIDPDFLYLALLAALVFNVYNFRRKARCFAGDVGSVSMAFIILFALGKLMLSTGEFWYILLLAVYGTDSVLTIIHRLMRHENIFQAHRKHAYQIMANELKIPHLWVSGFYMLLQTLVFLGLLLTPPPFRWVYFIGVILLLSSGYVLFMKRFFHHHSST